MNTKLQISHLKKCGAEKYHHVFFIAGTFLGANTILYTVVLLQYYSQVINAVFIQTDEKQPSKIHNKINTVII